MSEIPHLDPDPLSMAQQIWRHDVAPDFSRPEKPAGNAFAETFIGRVPPACLDAYWLMTG